MLRIAENDLLGLQIVYFLFSMPVGVLYMHIHTHTYFSDGIDCTGAFICIHAQLEHLKTEGVVNFFQFIKSARIQRAGLVPDVVSQIKRSRVNKDLRCYLQFCSISIYNIIIISVIMWWLTILPYFF